MHNLSEVNPVYAFLLHHFPHRGMLLIFGIWCNGNSQSQDNLLIVRSNLWGYDGESKKQCASGYVKQRARPVTGKHSSLGYFGFLQNKSLSKWLETYLLWRVGKKKPLKIPCAGCPFATALECLRTRSTNTALAVESFVRGPRTESPLCSLFQWEAVP